MPRAGRQVWRRAHLLLLLVEPLLEDVKLLLLDLNARLLRDRVGAQHAVLLERVRQPTTARRLHLQLHPDASSPACSCHRRSCKVCTFITTAVRRHVISCGCDWARRDAPGRGRSLRVFTQIPPPRQTAGRHPNTTCASLQGLPPPTCSLQLFVPATQRAGRLLHVVSCGCDWARRDALGRGRCTPKYHLSASHPRFPPPPTVSSSFRQQATLIHTTAYRGRAGARMPPSLALGEELPRRVTVTA